MTGLSYHEFKQLIKQHKFKISSISYRMIVTGSDNWNRNKTSKKISTVNIKDGREANISIN